jgi:glycosyltransferase involved in cell wall biosynthesis
MRICILSMSRIADDPRVRRHGDALAADGHDLVAVGLSGSQTVAPSWPVREVRMNASPRTSIAKAGAAAAMTLARAMPSLAEPWFWRNSLHRRFLEEARQLDAQVYQANDWPMLPIAARAAQQNGGTFVYDSHEYGVEENFTNRRWRLFYPPFIRALEGAFIHDAAFVSTVGGGIADLLQRDYRLSTRPLVVRNVPRFVHVEPRQAGTTVEVLYQGLLHPERGLEPLLDSVRMWRPEFHLVVRGPGAKPYVDELRRQAAASPAADRIRIDEPVSSEALVRAAATATIGVHPIPGVSRQNEFCLPNKFFEYVMAGLAVCVSDLAEMRELVREFDLGYLIAEPSAAGIASAINRFDRRSIELFRKNARNAATVLCWERERTRLLDAYETIQRAG